LIRQVWSARLDAWPAGGTVDLPSPLAPVIGVRASFANGEAAATPAERVLVEIERGADGGHRLRLIGRGLRDRLEQGWAELALDVTAGFGGAPSDVPAPLRRAVAELTTF